MGLMFRSAGERRGSFHLRGWHKNSQKEKEAGGWSFCRSAAAPDRGLHTQSTDVFFLFFYPLQDWVHIKRMKFFNISKNWWQTVRQSFINNFGLNFEHFGLTFATSSSHFKHYWTLLNSVLFRLGRQCSEHHLEESRPHQSMDSVVSRSWIAFLFYSMASHCMTVVFSASSKTR